MGQGDPRLLVDQDRAAEADQGEQQAEYSAGPAVDEIEQADQNR
jgi:hypothetical protein